MMRKLRTTKDYSGTKFNKLLVIKRSHLDNHHNWEYLCKCDCGNFVTVKISNLKRNSTKACGCLRGKHTKLPFGKAAFNALYTIYKRSAKNRNIEFAISKRYFKKLTQQNCYYCNEKPSQIQTYKTCNGYYVYNGIDRKDNNLGYTLNNTVTCCKICNYMKHTQNSVDFINKCIKICQFKQVV